MRVCLVVSGNRAWWYGQLLLVWLALFGVMLAPAGKKRFCLTPALNGAIVSGDTSKATAALSWSLALEASAALIILGLVAWLGTLAPPMTM